MEYTFLKEDIEALMLFLTAPVYLFILSILQSKNLKSLDRLKHKKLTKNQRLAILSDRRRLKIKIPFFVLIGGLIHVLGYIVFSGTFFRYGYFISIAIMYFIYLFVAFINLYLKGAGVLKDIGKFGGLPG